jgi:hypothetical protein
MMSQSFIWVVCVSLTLLSTLAFAQDLQPEPMPEPTAIYTCGENYQPVDLAFDGQGTLYSTDGQLLVGGGFVQYIEGTNKGTQPSNYLYRHTDSGCQIIIETTSQNLFGMIETPSGDVCYHEGNYPIEPIKSQINCIDTAQKMTTILLPMPGLLTNLTFYDDGFIGLYRLESITEEMPTLVTHFPHLQTHQDSVELGTINEPVNFIAVANDGTAFMSLLPSFTSKRISSDGKEVTFPTIVKILDISQGVSISFDSFLPFPQGSEFVFPSGIAIIDDSLFVADYKLGQLRELSLDGKIRQMFEGLEGPMGITQAPNGDFCVAEMTGARISCYSLASLGLE